MLAEGRVILRQGRNFEPLTTGRVGASDEQGQMYESTAIGPDGRYQLRLRPNQRSIIQVLVREYVFSPATIQFFPSNNRPIPDFIGRARQNGSVEVTLKPHPSSSQTFSMANQRFLVTDAETGRLLSTFRTDRKDHFRYNGSEGSRIIIKPQGDPRVQYIPPALSLTLTPETQKVDLVYVPVSEVGVGNKNLAKDNESMPQTVAVGLRLNDLAGGKLLVGDEVELSATPSHRAPADSRYTFLVRYDNERNFRTLANLQRGTTTRFTLERAGGFEYKVALFSQGIQMGGAIGRNYALASSKDKAPGVKHHDPSASFGFIDDFPQQTHMDLRFTIDRSTGPALQPRRLNLDAWKKADQKSQRVPREGRRLTFLTRHEDDSEWTIAIPNSPTLEWFWTPPRAGKWVLRVDYVKVETADQSPDQIYIAENGRAQISFTAVGGGAVRSSSSHLEAETQPAENSGYRPVAIAAPEPTATPRRIPRPVNIASPKATPRPTFKPLPIATPQPQATPAKSRPSLIRTRPTADAP